MTIRGAALLMVVPALLAGCKPAPDQTGRPETSRAFPRAYRPVSEVPNASGPATEVKREQLREAERVMDLAALKPGMTVADIGAGDGYYTVRLAERVEYKGRVLAQDIDRAALDRLGSRVMREDIENVSIKQGNPDDPRLPAASFDRIFLIHVYQEVDEPYAFLWRLRPALRPGGKIVVFNFERPIRDGGVPPAVLFCEFNAVGFRLGKFVRMPDLQGYYAEFDVAGNRPEPEAIKPCGAEKGKIQ